MGAGERRFLDHDPTERVSTGVELDRDPNATGDARLEWIVIHKVRGGVAEHRIVIQKSGAVGGALWIVIQKSPATTRPMWIVIQTGVWAPEFSGS